MSFTQILDTLLFKPLQLLFEIIYVVANRLIDNPGGTIVVLSLVMNFLVLPLYKRADALQEEERRMELQLRKGVVHIKKTFKGDEQMLMLRTYYRQNNYKPTYVLRGAASLFLEIPFFIAAYRFLSGLQLLNGVAFGPIMDLGQPDGMLKVAGLTINILPVIMTAVNLISCVIFTKGSLMKTKLQLYGMAVFFFIFLYSSPSGLVFYWTLNNVFSLIKTIFYKLKSPRKILNIIFSITGVGIFLFGFFVYKNPTPKLVLFFTLSGMLMQIPSVCALLKKYNLWKLKYIKRTANKTVFFSGGMFMSIFMGVLIPSAVIKSSPQEFVSTTFFYHPIWFIVSSFCIAFGIFVIWLGVFYWLASPMVKPVFDRAMWIFSGISVLNYMFFSKNFGNLTSELKYENELKYVFTEQIWNFIIILVVMAVLYIFYEYLKKRIHDIIIIGIIAFSIMSISNIVYINSSIETVKNLMAANADMPKFTLSKNGKNVIVLMLDRAMGEQVPYIFNEKPELKEQFEGFTYYSNTISFGKFTNFGTPALLGGYEYTPVEINKRKEESLVSKHNEALKVMPVLFDQNDFKVTVINPVYANYQWIPDLSIYDDYPEIERYITGDKFLGSQAAKTFVQNSKRNFYCYSMLKVMPLCVQKTIYNDGKYNQIYDKEEIYSGQELISSVSAEGMNANFIKNYNVLENFSKISNITEEDSNTFLFMANDITHEPMLLQEPEYVPALKVDNTLYEDSQPKRILNGRILKLEKGSQMIHYHANMAAMIQLGKWFDFLRKEGVYDNTRIILVSDHGSRLRSIDELILSNKACMSSFYPLLMIKDFGSQDFTVSDEFMTNGDVPTMAVDGIIDNPVNPFTGKMISSDEKTAHNQYIIDSEDWEINVNNGNTFLPAKWYSVHDNIWDKKNWKIVAEEAVLPLDEQ